MSAEIDFDAFLNVELRVAVVEAAEAVPKSKKLLKLAVNLGEQLGTRQIISGIAQFYTPESLIGRRIVVVANLKPAQLMGLESQGMLLASSNADSSRLIILDPGQEMEAGALVR
jgi:methionyl-tRNA synthetase